MAGKVMFVDDQGNLLKSLKWLFADAPFSCDCHGDPDQALAALEADTFAVVVADQRMPKMSGTAFLDAVRKVSPDTIRILTTAYADMEATVRAINQAHVYRFLPKPWDEGELKQVIQNALTHYELGVENRRLTERLQARNAELQAINRQLKRSVSENIKASEAQCNELQAMLIKAQKMEALGNFAGGIAHDFNNILTAILGYTELAQMQLTDEHRATGLLDQIDKAGRRAQALTQQILTFSRRETEAFEPVRIDEAITETLRMLNSILPATITVRENIAPCGQVMANETQIQQIIMNVCTNAYHAMQTSGGLLAIELSEVALDQDTVIAGCVLKGGAYGKIVISDTGPGIAPDVLDRIFEPYFTTKKKEKGTGLGLAVVHGIVRSHNGAIGVKSQLGRGAVFSIYLPLIDSDQPQTLTVDPPVAGGNERILFVDDEPALVDIGRQILARFGYHVVALTDSRSALALFRSNPEQFDLVITDMTMPSLTGDRLATELLSIRPELPIILCTGFSEQISPQRAQELGIAAYSPKPFVSSELARTVRSVLDATGLSDPTL